MKSSTGNLFTSPACAIPALKPYPYGKQCYRVIRFFMRHGWTVTGPDISNLGLQNIRARFSDIRDRVRGSGAIVDLGGWRDGKRFTKYTVPDRWRGVLRALAPDREAT